MGMSMNQSKFAHLHLHSHFSLLDGANKIDAVVQRAAELGMPAIALTDHGNLFGAVQFHDAGYKHGVKPIIGCEVYVLARAERSSRGALTRAIIWCSWPRTKRAIRIS